MTQAEYRAMLKRNHFCVRCRKQDAYTLGGRTYCFECAEKNRLAQAEARKDPVKREKANQKARERAARLAENGQCVQCGGIAIEGKRRCKRCQNITNKWFREHRARTPRLLGVVCWRCNKSPCENGKKLCKECYEKQLPIMLAAAEASKAKRHRPEPPRMKGGEQE